MLRWGYLLCWAMVCASGVSWAQSPSIDLEGRWSVVSLDSARDGLVTRFALKSTNHNFAAGPGLIDEGFGVGSFYVPSRRLNSKTLPSEKSAGHPIVTTTYECDGANIDGLNITRVVEPHLDGAQLRVSWSVVNKGTEEQWVAPWVHQTVSPGGTPEGGDRVDVPTVNGIRRMTESGYHLAARNWAAVTDAASGETFCTIFNADLLHSFLIECDPSLGWYGLQGNLLPRVFKPGESWQTVYYLTIVRGLAHVDFASEELAAQIDFKGDRLEVVLASAIPLPACEISAGIRGEDGQKWPLPKKKFALNPQRPVRCTYPWTAPGEGAYEFLARLEVNGKPLLLGQQTGSPHGGIDAQFVVGPAAGVRFEPWTNAPYALDRGARTVKRVPAATTADTQIWFESGCEKVFREDTVQCEGTAQPVYSMSAARNEAESLQIVVRPPKGKDLRALTVTARDLLLANGGSGIAASNIEVCNVAYYPVRVPSYYEGPTGEWPDALPPFSPVNAKGGQNTPFWVTVQVPMSTPPGVYEGPIELTSPDLPAPVQLRLRVKVSDFTLPKIPALKTDVGFDAEQAERACARLGYSGGAQELFAAYLDNALRHRVTLTTLVTLPAPVDDYPTALAAWLPKARALLDAGASNISVPPALLAQPERLAQANAFVLQNGLKGRVFGMLADEPERAEWPRVFERIQQWNTAAPDIPAALTALGLEPFLPESAGRWVVHLPVMDTPNNRPILERVAQGGEVWGYVNHAPPRPYANLFIDFAAIEHRALFWQLWALGFKGFRYPVINGADPEGDPYRQLLDITPAQGNGFLVYPSMAGPVNSIRWEVMRDGIEDYDYLVLFAERTKALEKMGGHAELLARCQAAANLNAILPNLTGFSRDPNVFLQKRAELAQLIEEAGRALGI